MTNVFRCAILNTEIRNGNKLNEILAANTGKSVEEISRDTERDNYMTAQEAVAYGLIDSVVEKR